MFDIRGSVILHTVTLRTAINLLVLTWLYYKRCSKISYIDNSNVRVKMNPETKHYLLDNFNYFNLQRLDNFNYFNTCTYHRQFLIICHRQFLIRLRTRIQKVGLNWG